MTREQVHEKVLELTSDLSDEELQHLVTELVTKRQGWTVSDADWAELDAASRAVARGEGTRVEDIDAFIDELDPATPA